MLEPHNPFAPPVTDEPPEQPWAQAGPRSVVPRVFGVLSIVFSSLLLFLFLIGAAGAGIKAWRQSQVAARARVEQAPPSSSASKGRPVRVEADPAPPRPPPARSKGSRARTPGGSAVSVVGGVSALLFLLLTPALLVLGIGQVRYRRWALTPTIIWAVLALFSLGGLVGMAAADPQESGGALVGMITSFAFFAPYPILLLVFFTRPRTIAALRRRG